MPTLCHMCGELNNDIHVHTCTVWWQTFEGENFLKFRSFGAICESFLHKIWGHGVHAPGHLVYFGGVVYFGTTKSAKVFSAKIVFAEFFPLESFPLYSTPHFCVHSGLRNQFCTCTSVTHEIKQTWNIHDHVLCQDRTGAHSQVTVSERDHCSHGVHAP